MFIRVPLERIRDNPFQNRADYGDVGELAASLLKMKGSRPETSGLLQVPPGRIVVPATKKRSRYILDPAEFGGAHACLADEPQAVVELAAGHRRVRAFMQLLDEGNLEYAKFPVDVGPLGDQAMADIAWEENAKRKDLSPIEEAEALQRAMNQFGWTQAEIGRRWGLSQPAVANKIRLLDLPDEAQAAIRAGQLSERHGRALLAAAGKSQRIYRAVAVRIIPRPAAAEAVERARVLLTRGSYNLHTWFKQPSVICEACGDSVDVSAGEEAYAALTGPLGDGAYSHLCQTCYRAATDWTPPSAAETDKLVEQTVYRQIVGLLNPRFPLDVEITAAGPGDIISPRCADCQTRHERAGRPECLDRQCYDAKRKLWEARQGDELVARLRERYPDAENLSIDDDFHGYDLRAGDQVDEAMLRDGVCGPHCPRLKFRRVFGDHYLRPFDDLPFAYCCNNSNSHAACQRRYLAGRRSDDEVAADEQLKNSVAGNRQAANVLLRRARLSVGRALLDGHVGVWQELAVRFGAKKPELTFEDALAHVAGQIIGYDLDCLHDWAAENAVETFERELGRYLGYCGVALLPGPEDVARRLERIAGFVLDDEHGRPRAELRRQYEAGEIDAEDFHLA